MYWFGGFEYFVKSGFEKEPLMLGKQMIPHFKGLDVVLKYLKNSYVALIGTITQLEILK